MTKEPKTEPIDPDRFRSDPDYRLEIEARGKEQIRKERLRFDLAAEIGARVYRSPERPEGYKLDEERFRTAVTIAERIYCSDLKL